MFPICRLSDEECSIVRIKVYKGVNLLKDWWNGVEHVETMRNFFDAVLYKANYGVSLDELPNCYGERMLLKSYYECLTKEGWENFFQLLGDDAYQYPSFIMLRQLYDSRYGNNDPGEVNSALSFLRAQCEKNDSSTLPSLQTQQSKQSKQSQQGEKNDSSMLSSLQTQQSQIEECDYALDHYMKELRANEIMLESRSAIDDQRRLSSQSRIEKLLQQMKRGGLILDTQPKSILGSDFGVDPAILNLPELDFAEAIFNFTIPNIIPNILEDVRIASLNENHSKEM
jgi:hypothetical protein